MAAPQTIAIEQALLQPIDWIMSTKKRASPTTQKQYGTLEQWRSWRGLSMANAMKLFGDYITSPIEVEVPPGMNARQYLVLDNEHVLTALYQQGPLQQIVNAADIFLVRWGLEPLVITWYALPNKERPDIIVATNYDSRPDSGHIRSCMELKLSGGDFPESFDNSARVQASSFNSQFPESFAKSSLAQARHYALQSKCSYGFIVTQSQVGCFWTPEARFSKAAITGPVARMISELGITSMSTPSPRKTGSKTVADTIAGPSKRPTPSTPVRHPTAVQQDTSEISTSEGFSLESITNVADSTINSLDFEEDESYADEKEFPPLEIIFTRWDEPNDDGLTPGVAIFTILLLSAIDKHIAKDYHVNDGNFHLNPVYIDFLKNFKDKDKAVGKRKK